MMISPKAYIMQFEKASYSELIKERDRMMREIRRCEKKLKNPDKQGEEFIISPSPSTIYKMNLEYLAELCKFMSERGYSSEDFEM